MTPLINTYTLRLSLSVSLSVSPIPAVHSLRALRLSLSLSLSLSASSMASVTGSAVSLSSFSRSFKPNQASARVSTLNSVPFSVNGKFFPSIKSCPARRFQVSCMAAKPETVQKVCGIVRKQLAIPDETEITGESKFATLGADSLDTVEIVMGLEEEFDISVEEESAQSITTVQDAADLIEKLIEKN